MIALQSRETHNITLKNLALFRPKLCNSESTNQIARFGQEQCCRIFNSNDAVDKILNEENELTAAGCCKLLLFVLVLKHGKCSVERLILHSPGKVKFLLLVYTKFL